MIPNQKGGIANAMSVPTRVAWSKMPPRLSAEMMPIGIETRAASTPAYTIRKIVAGSRSAMSDPADWL